MEMLIKMVGIFCFLGFATLTLLTIFINLF